MKVLIACEMSGTVRDAFTKKGHEAWSCDLQLCDKPGNHYWGCVDDILYKIDWDLIIAHPPCTYLCCLAGHYVNPLSRSFKPNRIESLKSAAIFFKKFLDHSCKKICVENPKMSRFGLQLIGKKQDQFIEPYMFGHAFSKKTGLWLKGLPKLQSTNIVTDFKSYTKTLENGNKKYVSIHRAITFSGIANAMANQWG